MNQPTKPCEECEGWARAFGNNWKVAVTRVVDGGGPIGPTLYRAWCHRWCSGWLADGQGDVNKVSVNQMSSHHGGFHCAVCGERPKDCRCSVRK